jgi:hypothetical protein
MRTLALAILTIGLLVIGLAFTLWVSFGIVADPVVER